MIDPIILALMKKMASSGESGEWAPLNSPDLTGTPTAPTAENGTNTEQIATTKFVQNAISATAIFSSTPALEGIEIILTNSTTGKEYTGTTDSNGTASIRIKEIGNYNITYNSQFQIEAPSTIEIEQLGVSYYCQIQEIEPVIYTVQIDLTNYSPSDSVTYADDAQCMTKGSSDWDAVPIFSDIKPCTFQNGQVNYYLDKDNFNYKEDGVTASNLTGTDGDIMIEIPRFGYKISKSDNVLTVSITNAENANGFNYYAFSREDIGDIDKFYWGAYQGSLSNGVLQSLPNKTPAADDTLANFKSAAEAKGTNYGISKFAQLTALQCLYLIKYGDLNGQAALGRGVCYDNSYVTTGGTETQGMYYGSTSDSVSHVKFAGIEDFWGNVWDWVDGIQYGNGGKFQIDTGLITHVRQETLSDQSGWIKNVIGDSVLGFIGSAYNGSETTHFCDNGALYQNEDFGYGGAWNYNNKCGPFCLYAFPLEAWNQVYYGARLTYT